MINAILIVGANLEQRIQKALQLIKDFFGLNTNLSVFADKIFNPDLFILEAQDSLGIAKIRELKQQIQRKPFKEKIKIAFVPEAEKLTLEAQNALLKTLEEPPADTIIILSSPVAGRLLPTIESRCQIIYLGYDFKNLEADPQLKVLNDIFSKKKAGERILAIQPYSSSRQLAVEFCQKTLLALHSKKSLKNFSLAFVSQSFFLLKSFQKALDLLQKNINPKLVLENLVLETANIYF